MLIPFLKPISNILKTRYMPAKSRHHLMLAGINQRVFVNQWGNPDIRIGLDRLHGYYESDIMVLNEEPGTDDFNTVWIYEKRNRIFFFRKGRLTSHFRWNDFKDKWKSSQEDNNPRAINKTGSSKLIPFSSVA